MARNIFSGLASGIVGAGEAIAGGITAGEKARLAGIKRLKDEEEAKRRRRLEDMQFKSFERKEAEARAEAEEKQRLRGMEEGARAAAGEFQSQMSAARAIAGGGPRDTPTVFQGAKPTSFGGDDLTQAAPGIAPRGKVDLGIQGKMSSPTEGLGFRAQLQRIKSLGLDKLGKFGETKVADRFRAGLQDEKAAEDEVIQTREKLATENMEREKFEYKKWHDAQVMAQRDDRNQELKQADRNRLTLANVKFNVGSTPYKAMKDATQYMRAATKAIEAGNVTSDLILVKALEKQTDPTSAVLQGEADSHKQASNFLGRLAQMGIWNAAKGKLTDTIPPGMRADMFDLIRGLYTSRSDAYGTHRQSLIEPAVNIMGYTEDEAGQLYADIPRIEGVEELVVDRETGQFKKPSKYRRTGR